MKILVLCLSFLVFVTKLFGYEYLIVANSDVEKVKSVSASLSFEKLFPQGSGERLDDVYRLKFGNKKQALSAQQNIKQLSSTRYVFLDVKAEVYNVDPDPSYLKGENSYFPYQWALNNHGQKISYPLNFDQLVKFPANPGYDIQFAKWQEQDKLVKRKVRVAVLDSGVYTAHPEFKGKIYHHQDACDGKIPSTEPYYNDCNGMNFAALVESDKPNVNDVYGHGTHIAGILAANDDGAGTIGISQNIEILPVKVFLDLTEYSLAKKDSRENILGTLTSNVAMGLHYSIYRGAEVINLSLGWPPLLDNPLIEDLIEIARKKDVVIVAASGNDSSFSQVKPCAFKNVVCVGFTDSTGKLSSYSNYGAHVDFNAPGLMILSTVPPKESVLFPAGVGYDYMTGSSQAAPMIAGMIAILKASFPGLGFRQLLDRMYVHSKPAYPYGARYFPLPSVFSDLSRKEFIRPEFKEKSVLSFDSEGRATLEFSVFHSTPMDISKFQFTASERNKTHIEDIEACVSVSEEELSCKIDIRADLEQANILQFDFIFQYKEIIEKRFFEIHASLNRDNADSILLARFNNTSQGIEFRGASSIFYGESGNTGFYQVDERVTLVRFESPATQALRTSTVVNANEEVTAIYEGDFNYDRQTDYLMVSIEYETNRKRKQKRILYRYLNLDAKPLFSGLDYFVLSNQFIGINSLNLGNMQWRKHKFLGHNIAAPVLWSVRSLVKDDSLPKYKGIQTLSTQGIFYLVPQACESGYCLEPKLFDTHAFYLNRRKQLSHSYYEVVVSRSLSADRESFYSGKNFFLLREGTGVMNALTELVWNEKGETEFHEVSRAGEPSTLGLDMLPVVDLNQLSISGYVFYYSGSYVNSLIYYDRKTKKLSEHKFDKDPDNPSFGSLVSFKALDGSIKHISFNKKRLSYRKEAEPSPLSVMKRLKNTLIPFVSLAQSFNPMFARGPEGRYFPILFVEESYIEASQTHFIRVEENSLRAEIRDKVRIPDGCTIENPVLSLTGEPSYGVRILCKKILQESLEYRLHWYWETL